MITAAVYLVVGIIFLAKGADWLVRGASGIARWFGIPAIIVGLTVVSIGTSMPELVVSLLAAIQGSADLSLGNILGSNISNVLLILGISAVIVPLSVESNITWREIPFSLLAVIVLGVMANDVMFNGTDANSLGRNDGIVLLAFFVIFLYYILAEARAKKTIAEKMEEAHAEMRASAKNRHSLIWFIGSTLIGLVVLFFGGQGVVTGATGIAKILGISDAIIGLSIVAVGTSLPELAASAVAAWRKESDIAVGNVVGSNIFNILWVLGATAAVRPLYFSPALNADVLVVVVVTLVLFGAIFLLGKKAAITRSAGITFILLYAAYVIYLITRELG